MPSPTPSSGQWHYLLETLMLVVLIALVVGMTQMVLVPNWREQALELLRTLVN